MYATFISPENQAISLYKKTPLLRRYFLGSGKGLYWNFNRRLKAMFYIREFYYPYFPITVNYIYQTIKIIHPKKSKIKKFDIIVKYKCYYFL